MLAAVLAYVALQFWIGMLVSRRVKDERDYLVAGRSIGPRVAVFSVFATWFGAETCIGSAGQAYSVGLSGTRADPFGYAGCLLLMGLFFAAPLWRRGLSTFADLFRQRFGPGAERLCVLIVAPTSLLWAAAQIRAFAQVLGHGSGLEVELAIALSAAVVIAYTTVGGTLADALTDVVQGVVLVSGLLLILGLAYFSADWSRLAQLPAERFSLLGAEQDWLLIAEAWAVPILGSVMAPELVTRVLSTRSPAVARNATLAASLLYLAMGSIPVLMGLLAAQVLPGLAEPEQVLLHQATRYLPGFLYVVFAGALVSAILSTVDSALLVTGSLVAHNVILPTLGAVSSGRALRINRLCVAGAGMIAYLLARSAEGVYALVEEASAFGSTGVLVSALFALYGSFGGARSAVASLLTGVVVYSGGAYVLHIEAPYLTSLAAALLAYVGFAFWPESRERAAAASPP
jgi:SSS family solute:Na+ symporter